MEKKDSDYHDNFFASLNQLILSLEPAIKEAGSVSAAEDILAHLEATDENFHRYDFVRQLRSRIDTTLTPLIDKKLEQLTGREGDRNNSVPTITEEIIASPEFVNLQQSILADTKDAVNALIQSFSQNPGLRPSDYELTENRGRLQPFRLSLDSSDEDSSMSSSFGQTGYMFNMSPEKFTEIAENLDPDKPLHVRINALSTLYQFPLSDELTSKNSEGIRKGLLAALADEDEQLAEKSLKFHARMFMASSAHVTKEIYTCLAEHLESYFSDTHRHRLNIENGLDVSTRNNQRLLKRFRLLNEFQHEVASFWIRYPEWFLESVLGSTFNLFAASSDPEFGASVLQYMTPLHCLALVDPKATWFKKWMHGNYSRTVAIREVKKHPSLLVDAISHCIDFSRTCKTLQSLEMMELNEQQRDDDSDGLFYTSQDLEYIYFVHSLCLLGRVLLYSGGRALFPVILPDTDETVTISSLLVALIRIMSTALPNSNEKTVLDVQFHPGYLVCDVLKKLASCTNASKECLCKDVITTSLLSPVQAWLDGIDSCDSAGAENTLLFVADVLATLAASETGQRQLLYGEAQDRWQRSRFSPAHTIAKFAKKALLQRLPGGTPPKTAISGFVFVCRQLYSTCDGLMVLNPYELHQCVANAWIKVHEPESPTEAELASDETQQDFIQDEEILVWESSLIDNLLNFAGTPKGLLLLQQTGKMNECVAFMNERYNKKLQVSKCEKFGYGLMVTQIAATAPGMVALENRGFLKRMVLDIWTVFEGAQDRKPAPPRIKHVDSIDSRTYNKSMNNLLSVLSAFPAVYEVLADAYRPSTSGSEIEEAVTNREAFSAPVSIMDLVDRFIMIDSEEKFHSLFNFEQSHHFGLRVLSVLCSCLDTFLFLECRYRFQELLLQSQLDIRFDNGKDYIIDMCSLERNHILVKTYHVGGTSERIIPGRTLTENVDNPYPWPLFSSYPPPKDYLPGEQHAKITAFEEGDTLLEFLEGSELMSADSFSWLQDCRKTFCQSVTSGKTKAKGKVLKLLLDKVCTALTNVPEEAIFPLIDFSASESSLKNVELTDIESLGTKVAVRYGVQLKLLQSTTDGVEDLTYLLKYCKFFLQGQQRTTESTLRTLSGEYVGHDWFVSTIFLMMYGDPDLAWEFLFKFSSLVSSGYLWIRRLHASVHLPMSLTVSGIPPLYSCTCHNVELILMAEVPLVYSAFRMSGYTPSQICQHWLRQCFWNYLDWEEICLYICTCLTMGIDYQVYYCIAILRHLQQDILRKTQQKQLLIFLKENPIGNFKVADQLTFMQELEARYRPTILCDLQNITKP